MNKVSRILNPQLAQIVAAAGHFDEITLADCGLPLPQDVPTIDLSVVRGTPTFEVVFNVLMAELKVERLILAREIQSNNDETYQLVISKVSEVSEIEGQIPVELIPHCDLKVRVKSSRCVVRTGENTPYANVIFVAGVSF